MRNLAIITIIMFTAVAFGEFKDDAEVTVKLSDAELVSLEVKPDPVVFNETGKFCDLKVTGHFKDGTASDLSLGISGTEYISDLPEIVSVNEDGRVTAGREGIAVIRVSNSGIFKDVRAIVEIPYLQELRVSPSSLLLMIDQHSKLKVDGIYSDGSVRNIANAKDGTSYITGNKSIVEVSKNGVAEAVSEGDTFIRIENSGLTATVDVSVIRKNMPLTGISVKPETVKFTRAGEVKQPKVIGVLANGDKVDLTSSSSGTVYHPADRIVADVSADGLITAVDNGFTVIDIENSGFKTFVEVTVELALLVEIEVEIEQEKLTRRGEKTRVRVTGIYSDGSRQDISASRFGTGYVSDNDNVASVSPEGVITAVDTGIAVISVTNGMLYKSVSNEVVFED